MLTFLLCKYLKNGKTSKGYLITFVNHERSSFQDQNVLLLSRIDMCNIQQHWIFGKKNVSYRPIKMQTRFSIQQIIQSGVLFKNLLKVIRSVHSSISGHLLK